MQLNPNKSNALPDAAFKDDSPLKTVRRIKKILAQYGIETQERWGQSQVPYCHSIRVTVAGTSFGVNGKGVNKDFALASGYGELMERLQWGYICQDRLQKDGTMSTEDQRAVMLPMEKLLEQSRHWYEAYARKILAYTGQTFTPEDVLKQYADDQGQVSASPFYCVNRDETMYLPTTLRKTVYTTNGCAAGNTPEEALVQGISEIVERNHQLRILVENLTPPDVPETVLQSCKVAWGIISFLRESGFRVYVKDCSLGTRFPVICVCILNLKNGKYHTHFGAYPIFEIALQRALTESFQGRSIENIATQDAFCYKKEDLLEQNRIATELVNAEGAKMPEFFVGQPSFPYHAAGFSGANNRQLLKECIAFFRDQGLDVLVQDSSCLGFPTYQVIVPGYSELYGHRLVAEQSALRYATYGVTVLRNPAAATPGDMLGCLMHLNESGKLLSGVTSRLFMKNARLSASLTPAQDAYLMAASMAYIHYSLGKTANVVKFIDKMLSLDPTRQEYLLCVKRYLSLKLNKYPEEQIRAVLSCFHQEQTVEEFFGCLERKENPLDGFVLHCDLQCSPRCRLYSACGKQKAEELSRLVREKTALLDYDQTTSCLKQLLCD